MTQSEATELERRIKESLRPFVGKLNVYETRSDMVDAVILVLAKWDVEHDEKEISPENRAMAVSMMDKHFVRDS